MLRLGLVRTFHLPCILIQRKRNCRMIFYLYFHRRQHHRYLHYSYYHFVYHWHRGFNHHYGRDHKSSLSSQYCSKDFGQVEITIKE